MPVAARKAARAVDRVDDDHALGTEPGVVVDALLGKPCRARPKGLEPRFEEAVDGVVRLGDRRAVALPLDAGASLAAGLEETERDVAGLVRQGDEARERVAIGCMCVQRDQPFVEKPALFLISPGAGSKMDRCRAHSPQAGSASSPALAQMPSWDDWTPDTPMAPTKASRKTMGRPPSIMVAPGRVIM